MFDPKLIEALKAVVNAGSFQGAAQALNLSVAAVSLRIKSLEESLGARVLVRGKTVRLTVTGQTLMAYAQRAQMLHDDVLSALQTGGGKHWQTLSVAVNADSVSTWFLPGVAPLLAKSKLLIDIVIDDQDYTHAALKNGDVLGCVTTLATPMQGCVAEPLGHMRYRCLARPDLVAKCLTPNGQLSVHKLLKMPAIIFNQKDALQDTFLLKYFDLQSPQYPKHYVPAIEAFAQAIELGLGWGMVPDLISHLDQNQETINTLSRASTIDPISAASAIGRTGSLDAIDPISPISPIRAMGDTSINTAHPKWVEVMPHAPIDIALYWQHWSQMSQSVTQLTKKVKETAQHRLLQRH
jgi:LysR family transcriptional regulator (chromosome initiation inhibitor)